MKNRVYIGKLSELQEDEVRAYDVGGREVAVALVGGKVFAFSNLCTHKECRLSEGIIEDDSVVCYCHGSAFDLGSGRPLNLPAKKPLEIFDAVVEGDDLYVEIQS